MLHKKYFPLTIVFTFFLSFVSFSQNNKIDSLLSILKIPKKDTTTLNTLNFLSWTYAYEGKYTTADSFARQAIKLSEDLLNTFEIKENPVLTKKCKSSYTIAIERIGAINLFKGDYFKALEYYFKALKINEKSQNKRKVSQNLYNIAGVYELQGNHSKSLEYSFRSLRIREELGDKQQIADQLCGIGISYWGQGESEKALEYLMNSLKTVNTLEINFTNKQIKGSCFSNIGVVFLQQNNGSKALEYFFKALNIAKELDDRRLMATSLGNIGTIYFDQADYSKSLDYYTQSLKISTETDDKYATAMNFGKIGQIYNKQHKENEAEVYYQNALKIAIEIGDLELIKNQQKELADLYKKQKQWQKALEYYEQYITARDSIYNKENTKKALSAEMNFEFEKKKQAEKLITEATLSKKKIITNSIITILILVIIFTIALLWQQLLKRKQDQQIFKTKQALNEKENALLKMENQQIETELTSSKKILDNYTESLLKKNELLEQFNVELEKLKNLKSKEIYEEKIDHLDSLSKFSILTKDDWDKFKKLFEQVYKGFFVRLKEKLPDLTPAEIRIICLIKLKLDTKQIANILGISGHTVNITRYRLRKKINLQKEESIENIIDSI